MSDPVNKTCNMGSVQSSRSSPVRSRLLLYLEELGVDDITGLVVAAECLRRVGTNSDHQAAMDALEDILRERDIPDGTGAVTGLSSFPLMNRRCMVSRAHSGRSRSGLLRALVTRVFRRCLSADSGRLE